jgi:hypothetical protein
VESSAAVPRGAPHAGAFSREEFDLLLARLRERMGRRMNLFTTLGLGGMLLIAFAIMLLPLAHQAKLMIINRAMLLFPLVRIGTVIGARSTWRRVGLECPACRRNPLDGRNISVVRTGICPHCPAVIIRPAA